QQYLEAVTSSCSDSQIIVVSHYHLDHFVAERNPRLYSGKTILAKSVDDLPARQAAAARRFFATIDGLPSEIVWADGRRFRFGKTEIGFSNPVWHGGVEAQPGKVLMTEVQRGSTKVLVASDVAGPVSRDTAELIASLGAQEVILDGYPSYGLGTFANLRDLVCSIINVCRILAAPQLRTLLIDHHLARDPDYPSRFRLCYTRAAALRRRFGTAAELTGQANVFSGTRARGREPARKPELSISDCRQILEQATTAGEIDGDWLAELDRLVSQ
ncbi:MAG: hypothetical protein ABIK43_07200, partial [candidate division WOR-3 bacterium]